jgi:hypothetical protein
MACRFKYNGCNKLAKMNQYFEAKRKFPFIDNPLENWECSEEEEKCCKQFKPFPPKMVSSEYEIKREEVLKDIPIEFHNFLGNTAWDMGHASGYEEVLSILSNLVADIKESIDEFKSRLVNCIVESNRDK